MLKRERSFCFVAALLLLWNYHNNVIVFLYFVFPVWLMRSRSPSVLLAWFEFDYVGWLLAVGCWLLAVGRLCRRLRLPPLCLRPDWIRERLNSWVSLFPSFSFSLLSYFMYLFIPSRQDTTRRKNKTKRENKSIVCRLLDESRSLHSISPLETITKIRRNSLYPNHNHFLLNAIFFFFLILFPFPPRYYFNDDVVVVRRRQLSLSGFSCILFSWWTMDVGLDTTTEFPKLIIIIIIILYTTRRRRKRTQVRDVPHFFSSFFPLFKKKIKKKKQQKTRRKKERKKR